MPGGGTDSFPLLLQLSLAGNVATAILPGLQKNTDYKISIWAYYKDGARSDTVSVHHRTSKWPALGRTARGDTQGMGCFTTQHTPAAHTGPALETQTQMAEKS